MSAHTWLRTPKAGQRTGVDGRDGVHALQVQLIGSRGVPARGQVLVVLLLLGQINLTIAELTAAMASMPFRYSSVAPLGFCDWGLSPAPPQVLRVFVLVSFSLHDPAKDD